MQLDGVALAGDRGMRGERAQILGLWLFPNLTRPAEELTRAEATLVDLYGLPLCGSWRGLEAIVEQRRADLLLAAAAEEMAP